MASILGPIFMPALVYNWPCLHRKIASFFVVVQKYKTNFQRVGLFKILWLLNCQVSSSCQHMSTPRNCWLSLLSSKKYKTNYFIAGKYGMLEIIFFNPRTMYCKCKMSKFIISWDRAKGFQQSFDFIHRSSWL